MMKKGVDSQTGGIEFVEEGVRKLAQKAPSKRWMKLRIHLRVHKDSLKTVVDAGQELFSQTGALIFIPCVGLGQILFKFGSKPNLTGHTVGGPSA